jgi:hypothetical protein
MLCAALTTGGAWSSEPPPQRAKVKIEKGIRLKDAGSPGLYQFGRRDLRIYYNSREFGLATAESRNGKKWKKAQGTGINVANSTNTIVADASLIMLDGVLRLYFKVVPFANQDSHQVWRASATNPEGTEFEVDGRVFKRQGSPCFDWTSVPHAVVTHEGMVRLYFVCSKGQGQVAAAISDDGENFAFEQIVLPDAVDPYVVQEGEGYRMFYAAKDPGPSGRSHKAVFNSIYSALSEDGLLWGSGELIVSAEDFDVEATIDPAAYVFRNGRYRVYVPTALDLMAGTGFNIYSVQYTPTTFLGRAGR